jgi:dolichol-phosphate mannosyltransferase
MVFNYVVNNRFTYGDRRLTGARAITGLFLFIIVCSVGGLANVGVANLAIHQTHSWSLSGIAGALMGAFFNFGVANKLVWGDATDKRRRRKQALASF